jgi:hypothetical protein
MQGIGKDHRHGGRLPQNLNNTKWLSTGIPWMTSPHRLPIDQF